MKSARHESDIWLYDDEGDLLLEADKRTDRVILLPSGDPRHASKDPDRIRIQWGQHLLADLVAGRYRTAVCAVNDVDNAHGIVGELLELVPTSQWNVRTATAYAKVFHESVADHAPHDSEPYVLKYDLDQLLIRVNIAAQMKKESSSDYENRKAKIAARKVHKQVSCKP